MGGCSPEVSPSLINAADIFGVVWRIDLGPFWRAEWECLCLELQHAKEDLWICPWGSGRGCRFERCVKLTCDLGVCRYVGRVFRYVI
jgi:hypothetical protein